MVSSFDSMPQSWSRKRAHRRVPTVQPRPPFASEPAKSLKMETWVYFGGVRVDCTTFSIALSPEVAYGQTREVDS